jgi:hypothetical protein
METIVVGVDGSEGARAALAFAAREAALRKARLRIVCAWEIPPAVYGGGFAPTLDQPTLDGFRTGAETVVQEAVAAAKELQSTIECEGRAVQGQPGRGAARGGARRRPDRCRQPGLRRVRQPPARLGQPPGRPACALSRDRRPLGRQLETPCCPRPSGPWRRDRPDLRLFPISNPRVPQCRPERAGGSFGG